MEQPQELLNELHQKAESFSSKFVLEELGKLETNNTWGDIIYHYTGSLSAVKGIIEKNELWATNLAYVNDAREIKIGIYRFIKVCNQIQGSLNQQNISYQILDQLKTKITNKNNTRKYSCSFTTEGDLLSQ